MPRALTITVNSSGTPRVTVTTPACAPANLQAEPYTSGETKKTRLIWDASTEPDLWGYNIYSAAETDPYFTRVATVGAGTTIWDMDDLWCEDEAVPVMAYAVTAIKIDETESFFSNVVLNNDRDRDGVTDVDEPSLSTDPDNPDTDGDNLMDGQEWYYGTNPNVKDTDGDGFTDYIEIQGSTDPLDQDSKPYEYYIPYYKARTDWTYYSSLALRNSSTTTAATVTVEAYGSDGTAVTLAVAFTDFTIEPSGQWAQVLPAINVEGWVKVTSTEPLTGLAWVGQLEGGWPRLMADVSLIGELDTTLVVPHVGQTIEGYNPNGGWTTKVNICNPQTTATDVTLTYYTTAGLGAYTDTIAIPASGSVSYDLAAGSVSRKLLALLPTDESFENGSVLIEADQGVAAFALYYDIDKVPSGNGTCYAGISAVEP